MTAVYQVTAITATVQVVINKGETCGLLFVPLDRSGAAQSAAGWRVAAQVSDPSGNPLATWSTAASTATATSAGITLNLVGSTTAAWTWDSGAFELWISAGLQPSLMAEGTFTARSHRTPLGPLTT